VHLTALESNVGEEMDPRFTSRESWQVHLPPQAAGNHGAVGDNWSHQETRTEPVDIKNYANERGNSKHRNQSKQAQRSIVASNLHARDSALLITCTYKHAHTHARTHTHTHTHTHIHTHHKHTHTHTNTRAHTQTHAHTHIHTHARTRAQTNTYTQTQACDLPSPLKHQLHQLNFSITHMYCVSVSEKSVQCGSSGNSMTRGRIMGRAIVSYSLRTAAMYGRNDSRKWTIAMATVRAGSG
jgi:hypothetical protein